MPQNLKYIFVTLLVGFSDRLVKFFVGSLPKFDLLFFQLQTIQINNKLSLSLPFDNQIAIILSAITIIVLSYYFNKFSNLDKYFFAAIIGAALSNLFDRLFFGGVLDYLNFLNISVINLADIIITICVIGIAINNYSFSKSEIDRI